MIATSSTVLVTGVNGFIASHIASQLLEDGYNVRGSVRQLDKGNLMEKVFTSQYGPGRFELVVVEDITQAEAFDDAVKGQLVSRTIQTLD